MTSVIETALKIYNETQEEPRQIASKNHILCDYKAPPLRFFGNSIEVKDDKIEFTAYDDHITKNTNIIAKYLLKNIDQDKNTGAIELGIPYKTSNLSLNSSFVMSLDILKWKYKKEDKQDIVSFCIPYENANVLDTLLALIVNEKPKLRHFEPKKPFKGKIDVEADIKELPRIPSYRPPIIYKDFEVPSERIVEKIENFRKRKIEKLNLLKKTIKENTGENPINVSCAIEPVSFHKKNGFEFLGVVNAPYGFEFRPTLLSTANAKFSEPLNLAKAGYSFHGTFELNFSQSVQSYNSSKVGYSGINQKIDKYFNAESLLDLEGISIENVNVDDISITKNNITQNHGLKKNDLERLLNIVQKAGSIQND